MHDSIIDKMFQYGLPTVLLMALALGVYKFLVEYVKRNNQNLDRMAERMNDVEDVCKDILKVTVTKNTEAVVENTKVLEEVKFVITNCKAHQGQS